MTSGDLSIRLAWISDLHLDHLAVKDPGALGRLGPALDREGAQAVLIGGDIADARGLEEGLRRLAERLGRPIYFVLGNHDYYFGSVDGVRARASGLDIPNIVWLAGRSPVHLGGNTVLVGHGGWGDAHRGDLDDFVLLTDYAAIRDLADTIDPADFWINGFTKREALVAVLQRLGEEAARQLAQALAAAGDCRNLLVLTHVTPFEATCTYRDRPGNDQVFPGFLWGAMTDPLLRFAESRGSTDILVLSGHTHQDARSTIRPNLRAWSFPAEYGRLHYRIVEAKEEGRWTVGGSVRV